MMTEEAAVLIAKKCVEEQGWPWIEPVDASYRKRIIFNGIWTILFSPVPRLGNRSYVDIDDISGEVRDKKYYLTEEAAVLIAKKCVEEQGWPWIEPIRVEYVQRLLVTETYSLTQEGWHIHFIPILSQGLGNKAWVWIDDITGEIKAKEFTLYFM